MLLGFSLSSGALRRIGLCPIVGNRLVLCYTELQVNWRNISNMHRDSNLPSLSGITGTIFSHGIRVVAVVVPLVQTANNARIESNFVYFREQ